MNRLLKALSDMLPNREKQKKKFFKEMKPKIIHTKTFYCDDDHPIVYYIVNENNEGVCEYCYTKFVYQPLEQTSSEKIQDELEPIPCPIHEDYDEEEDNQKSSNKKLEKIR